MKFGKWKTAEDVLDEIQMQRQRMEDDELTVTKAKYDQKYLQTATKVWLWAQGSSK